MKYDYEVTCPHCGVDYTIPYEDVRHHVYKILGTESAKKRPDLDEHLAYMRERMQAKWQGEAGKLSVYEQAILELSERENLASFKLREIADIIGLEGKHRVSYVSRLITILNHKGLLTTERRLPAFPVQQV
jgi:hypothetical protein